MTLVLPKEHGAWAMLIVPFLVSFVVHEQNGTQLLLFLGMFFLYLSLYPLFMMLRNAQNKITYGKWFVGYGALAGLFLSVPLLQHPGLLYLGSAVLPFLAVNVYFIRSRQERTLLNDFSAIAGMALGAVACGYLATGQWTVTSWWIWFFCVVFFMGSVFFVKSLLREKHNPRFSQLSWGYHGAVVIISLCLGNWLLMLAYLPSLGRALFCSGRDLVPLQIGKLEIVNSLWFIALLVLYLR